MAGSPPPSPPGQRRRRNKDQPKWRNLPSDGRDGAPPALPARKPGWLKSTRAWWRTVWGSPMAVAWVDADVPVLIRLAGMVDDVSRGESSAVLLSEIRHLEDRFGLSPLARRRLQWEISQAQQNQEPAVRGPAAVRRLRAVDPDAVARR